MRNKFDILEDYRAAINKALPPGAFLKMDRGEGLFITNARYINPQFSGVPGFRTEMRGEMAVLYPTPQLLYEFENSCEDPLGDLSRSVFRFRNLTASDSAILLFAEGLKLIQNGTVSAAAAYDKRVRQHIAAALREGTVGGCYASAVIDDYLYLTFKE